MTRKVDLFYGTISELGPEIRSGNIQPTELVHETLDRIARLNPVVNAYITVLRSEAIAEAEQAERELHQGYYRGPLHGIPIGVKDAFYTKGIRTTLASKILKDYVPDYDASVVSRLKEAGAIIIGKLNLHTFAYGATSTTSFFGPVRNPWNPNHMTGGSSGGSGASVASGMGVATLGTDSGGSIRIPAAACGVVGLKPTYGRVSLHGVFPLAWTLDHVGPLARSVEDVAILLNIMAGRDDKDPFSADVPVPDFTLDLSKGIANMTVGIPKQYFFDKLQPDVESAIQEALSTLESLGAKTLDIELPNLQHFPQALVAIMFSEASTLHERWLDTQPDGYPPDVLARLDMGRFISAVDYLRAQRFRSLLIEEFNRALGNVDVIVTPTLPLAAPQLDAPIVEIGGQAEHPLFWFPYLTRPINMTGHPAVSVPCGFSRDKLPIGLQIIGRHFDETTTLRVANAYEKATSYHLEKPPI